MLLLIDFEIVPIADDTDSRITLGTDRAALLSLYDRASHSVTSGAGIAS